MANTITDPLDWYLEGKPVKLSEMQNELAKIAESWKQRYPDIDPDVTIRELEDWGYRIVCVGRADVEAIQAADEAWAKAAVNN